MATAKGVTNRRAVGSKLMAPANFVWRKFEWEFRGQLYRFEVSRDGTQARFSSHNPGAARNGSSDVRLLDMPMAAWVALSDSVRQSNVQTRRAGLPARAGKAWSESEYRKMVSAFKADKPIAEIARQLSRTEGAIISRLAQAGLIERETFMHPPPVSLQDGAAMGEAGDRH